MKRKARIQTGIDDRLVAIYARKSRITNKGDSIGVQFKQSADYAINQLSLPEDYEFARYEDKGLSGYYSDRPDFQRLLRDIEMGKIKAVACYKLDRISRKTSDLMRLLEYFERHDVTLLVCSNNINTRISTSKIIIQVLAIIAEFERDILTERIQDNLMELAKDGRWLGGKTPTGFSSQRVTTGSGKNKSAISFLVPVQEEKEIVHAPPAFSASFRPSTAPLPAFFAAKRDFFAPSARRTRLFARPNAPFCPRRRPFFARRAPGWRPGLPWFCPGPRRPRTPLGPRKPPRVRLFCPPAPASARRAPPERPKIAPPTAETTPPCAASLPVAAARRPKVSRRPAEAQPWGWQPRLPRSAFPLRREEVCDP